MLLQRGDLLALGGQLGLERVDAGARGLGVALEVRQAAALLAGEALGLVTLDGDLRELLAQRVGLALDVLDPLQRGLQLGAGGLGLALALALDALERLGELVAGGLDGLLVLGADLLELGAQVGLLVLGVAAAELLELEDARLERAAGAVGAAAGLRERLLGAALGLGDGVGHAALDRLGGAGAVGLRALQALGELGTGGLGGLQGGGAGGVLVEARALEALHAREQLEVLGVVAAGLDLGDGALEVGAQARGLALGGVGAAAARLGVAARLLHLRGQGGGHALEVVDALQRGEQARDDRGGVVEVADRAALDAGIGVGDGLLDLGVGLGAGGLARGELLLDPRGRLGRAEDDERAGRAPALPGLDLVVERLAQRAHDDGVLLAHAQQHQVERQLEAEVLQEQREVEALVELDRDEDGLDRELAALGVHPHDVDLAARGRRLARLEERAPGLRGGRQRRLHERVEERLAEDLLGRAPEQQLSRLGPLGDGALAVREHEVAADDLLQQRVERILGPGFGRRGREPRRRRLRCACSRPFYRQISEDRQPFVEKDCSRAGVQRRATRPPGPPAGS